MRKKKNERVGGRACGGGKRRLLKYKLRFQHFPVMLSVVDS